MNCEEETLLPTIPVLKIKAFPLVTSRILRKSASSELFLCDGKEIM
jgi:hypothetical protein